MKIKNLELQDQEIRKRMAAIADENKEVQDKYQRQELVLKYIVGCRLLLQSKLA